MAVQIPRLKQIQTGGGQVPRGDRIKINLQDQSANILRTSQAVGSLAGEVLKTSDRLESQERARLKKAAELKKKHEDEKIDLISAENKQSYSMKNTEALQRLKNVKGDPTDAYNGYKVAEQKTFDELLASRPNLSARVQQGIKNELTKVQGTKRLEALKQHGAQQATYKHGLHQSTLKLEKSDLAISGGHIRPNDESSYVPFERGISGIKTTISKYGLGNGTVEKIEKGDKRKADHSYVDSQGDVVKVAWTKATHVEAAKELSEGVESSIKAVLNSGYTGESKIMLDKYKSFLDPKTVTRLNEEITKEDTTQKNITEAARIDRLPDAKQNSAEMKLTPENRSAVRKFRATTANQIKTTRVAREDRNFEAIMTKLDQMKKDGQVHGQTDLEKTTVYKESYGHLSSKQRKTLDQAFNAPKVTDQKALTKAYAVLRGEVPGMTAESMTSAQISELFTDLNEVDRRSMWNKFNSRKKKTNSSAASNRQYKMAEEFLKTSLLNEEIIEYKDESTSLDEDSMKIMNKSEEGLVDFMDGFPEGASRKEVKDYIDDFVKESMKAKMFTGGGFFGGSKGKWPQSRFKTDASQTFNPNAGETLIPITDENRFPLEDMERKEIAKLQKDYKRKFKRKTPRPDDPLFENYVRSLK